MGELPNHQKFEVFSDADIYVFNTCTTEGFPRTIWEAMATGIPIVCANYPGAETFLRDGEVRLFRQNDSQDLAAKIFEQVDLEEDLRNQDSRKAKELLKKNTLEASTANIVDILSKQQ